MKRRCFYGVAAAVMLLAVYAVCATPQARLAVEHMYCEPKEEMPDGGATVQLLPSLVAKGKCRGGGCPPLHGKQVMLSDCRWGSVNGVPAFVEETSGWYFFYLDEQRTKPLRPTDEEIHTIHDGERGYLRRGGGVISTLM